MGFVKEVEKQDYVSNTDGDGKSAAEKTDTDGQAWSKELGKLGFDWFKDKGHKKHGWKNVYHKEEWGDSKKYHDIFHDRDWKKKWNNWNKKKDRKQKEKSQASRLKQNKGGKKAAKSLRKEQRKRGKHQMGSLIKTRFRKDHQKGNEKNSRAKTTSDKKTSDDPAHDQEYKASKRIYHHDQVTDRPIGNHSSRAPDLPDQANGSETNEEVSDRRKWMQATNKKDTSSSRKGSQMPPNKSRGFSSVRKNIDSSANSHSDTHLQQQGLAPAALYQHPHQQQHSGAIQQLPEHRSKLRGMHVHPGQQPHQPERTRNLRINQAVQERSKQSASRSRENGSSSSNHHDDLSESTRGVDGRGPVRGGRQRKPDRKAGSRSQSPLNKKKNQADDEVDDDEKVAPERDAEREEEEEDVDGEDDEEGGEDEIVEKEGKGNLLKRNSVRRPVALLSDKHPHPATRRRRPSPLSDFSSDSDPLHSSRHAPSSLSLPFTRQHDFQSFANDQRLSGHHEEQHWLPHSSHSLLHILYPALVF